MKTIRMVEVLVMVTVIFVFIIPNSAASQINPTFTVGDIDSLWSQVGGSGPI